MKDSLFHPARQLFDRLVDLDGEERDEILARECKDPDLRREVESLLLADASAPGFLDDNAAELAGPAFERRSEHDDRGRRLGAWVLEEPIGRGGTAVVYRARRADGEVERQVAIKLLTMAFLARGDEHFLREQQILARLRHPNIATLIEGGVAEDGTAYFVMELVEGRTIDSYCREEKLGTSERVRLFLAACDAVSYAHRHLVVHRDLKPGNILVDDEGQVRLLDFGIAKLLEEQDSTMTIRMLTPAYAAPEQLTGTPVTTATDVFGLGVVLYELLTDQRPPGFESRTPLEHEAAIRPPPPSRIAEHLDVDRDLDRVVRMAIHPDPQRRYENAQALAEDLRRWLDRRPVHAVPDSLSYRLSMFVRRHRLAVAGASLALAGILTGAGVALWQARVAQRQFHRAQESARLAEQEALRADRVRDFLVETFAAADPFATRGDEVTAREILEAGAARIEGELGDEPGDRLRLLAVLGTISFKLGDFERSERLLAPVLSSDGVLTSKEMVEVRVISAESASDIGRYQIAEERFQEAMELAQEEGLESDATEVALSLAGHFVDSRQPERAREILEPLLASSPKIFAEQTRLQATAATTLAEALQQLGDYETATLWGRRAVSSLLETAPGSLELAAAQAILAGIETSLGNLEKALELERSALSIRVRAFGERHPRTLISKNNLATLLKNRGRFDESAAILREVVAIQGEALGADHPHLAASLFNLGEALLLAGRVDEALESYSRAVAIRAARSDDRDPQLGLFMAIYGRALARAGRVAEARERFQRGLEILETELGPEHPYTARVLVEQAAFLNDEGESTAAAERLARAEPVIASVYGRDSRYFALASIQMGRALLGQGLRDEARERFETGLAILTQSPYRAQYAAEIEQARTLRVESAAPS